MGIRSKICILAAVLTALALSGCEDEKPIPMELTDQGIQRSSVHETYVPSWSHPDPMAYTPSPGVNNSGREIVKHDPLLSDAPAPVDAPDPVTDTTTNLANDTESPYDVADPLTTRYGPKNWYWLKGSISGGEVMVRVNGQSIGSFAVHMDREITDKLRPGYNTVEFTPKSDLSSTPVKAHLKIVYSQQDAGAAPVLVYDTVEQTRWKPLRLRSHSPDANVASLIGTDTDNAPRSTALQFLAE